MKLFQIEKRILQTSTNSKDIIQKDREHARRSSRARSTRGQENEAWAVYKKNPSRESWDDLSGDQYIICLKPPSPAGKILVRRQLFFLANHNSLEQTPHTRPNLPRQDSRDGFFLYTAQALFSWPHVDLARLLQTTNLLINVYIKI